VARDLELFPVLKKARPPATRTINTMESTCSPLEQALALLHAGALSQALARYDDILRSDPGNADALYYKAAIACKQGRFEDAVALTHRSLAVRPGHARALNLTGMALHRLGRLEEALASFDRALVFDPDPADTYGNRAAVLDELGRHAEAIAAYDRALQISPNAADDWCNRGAALQALHRFGDAIQSYDRALALTPDLIYARFNRANALVATHRFEEALREYVAVLERNPRFHAATSASATLLAKLGRTAEALATLDEKALISYGQIPQLAVLRASLLARLGRRAEAADAIEAVLAAAANDAEALLVRANLATEDKRHDAAIADCERILTIAPRHQLAFGVWLWNRMNSCQWEPPFSAQEISKRLDQGAVMSPFCGCAVVDSPAVQRRLVEAFVAYENPVLPPPMPPRRRCEHARIRLAYVSCDFNNHPVANLTFGLFERHDRARFEVVAISLGPDDQSEARARLMRAFDRFHDLRDHSDAAANRLIRDLEIDIAIDLSGYTTDARPFVLADRPAPVQVQYLGYPATMGASFIDYIIGDPIVMPPGVEPFYAEKVVRLPECFQVNDDQRPLPRIPPDRARLGLPSRGFVFCSFNNSYKLNPTTFEVWMRLLSTVADSVLWLLGAETSVEHNLRREAARHGVNPARLIFAPRVAYADYLARYGAADLFLDTLPFNGGTTVSDALWACLPVLTCTGDTFAGRMGASLLNAVGLPELVTNSLHDYEATAVALARDPHQISGIRSKLARNRKTYPLFDTSRLVRHLEAGYAAMWSRYRREEAPESFTVTRMPGRL
jgi:protein O-GlcNAc transferase